jgi:shikimate kinase
MMAFFVLVGPKHSGKTSTGRELARLLGLPFFDLDALIEERAGQSPRNLYRAGPAIFRAAEAEALAWLLGRESGGVLAAGGGIIDNPAAMALLQDPALSTVYLEVSAETAWQRIAGGELPPFLQAETMEKSREKHRLLHEQRSRAYGEFARISVAAGVKTPVETAEELCMKIRSGGAGKL